MPKTPSVTIDNVKIIEEGTALGNGFIILPGGLKWNSETKYPVFSHYSFDSSPKDIIGYITNIKREDNIIVGTYTGEPYETKSYSIDFTATGVIGNSNNTNIETCDLRILYLTPKSITFPQIKDNGNAENS